MTETTKIKLADATAKHLRQFARETLGLDVRDNETIDQLRAKIAPLWEKDEIVLTTHPEPVQSPPKPIGPADAPSEEMLTIIIDKTEDPGGDQPVWVSVNGRGLWIPRGSPAKVKKRYVHVLENAVRSVYEQIDDKGTLVERKVPSYPFRVLQTAA